MMEEKGHEEWVLNDLAVVGVSSDTALAYEPTLALLGLNGYNYWAADRRHPCSVLGMIYALEVIASVYGGPMTSAITDSLLLEGDRGISFISSHATMDAEHMAELRVILNQVEDDEAKDGHRRIDDFQLSSIRTSPRARYERSREWPCAQCPEPSVQVREAGVECRLRDADACAWASGRSSATAWRQWPNCSRSSMTSRRNPGLVRHFVMASDVHGVFNFGGDLSLFVLLVRAHDLDSLAPVRASMHRPRLVVENAATLGVHTTALVQGDALGGGLESALLHHTVIFERGAQAGFPEVLFNLFPGMGGWNLAIRQRRIHRRQRPDPLRTDLYGRPALPAWPRRHRRRGRRGAAGARANGACHGAALARNDGRAASEARRRTDLA